MTAKSNTEQQGICPETELAIRNFLRIAIPRFGEAIKDKAPEWIFDTEWKRGADGHFRERANRIRELFPTLSDEWLHAQPEFAAVAERMISDAVMGPNFGVSVGTDLASRRIQPEDILRWLFYALQDSGGHIRFEDQQFNRKWGALADAFAAMKMLFRTIAVTPNLRVPTFPLRLNRELVLDRLTADEVTQCNQVGVLQPLSKRFPLISADDAVGVRRELFLPKLFLKGDEPSGLPDAADEGRFGHRPFIRQDLVVDDVLSAMRLFKRTDIRSTGYASWAGSEFFASGTHFRVLRQLPIFGRYELSECEIPTFLELWKTLEEEASRFSFTIHRFNLSFDRGLAADRIVDLVIAAESLFLRDQDDNRGELSYRCSLRAAKFVEHPNFGERDVFQIMRRGYKVRNSVAHGESINKIDTRLPDDETTALPKFTDALEELVRLAIRKSLSMGNEGRKLRTPQYWDDLVFSKSDERESVDRGGGSESQGTQSS
jgi:hypothetical protein